MLDPEENEEAAGYGDAETAPQPPDPAGTPVPPAPPAPEYAAPPQQPQPQPPPPPEQAPLHPEQAPPPPEQAPPPELPFIPASGTPVAGADRWIPAAAAQDAVVPAAAPAPPPESHSRPATVWLKEAAETAESDAFKPALPRPEPEDPVPDRDEDEEPAEAIDALHRRVSGVEQRAMESLEVEISTTHGALEGALAKQAKLEQSLQEFQAILDERLARGLEQIRTELDLERRRVDTTSERDRLELETGLARVRELIEEEQRRSRELVDAELIRLREQFGREQTALADGLSATAARIEGVEHSLEEVDRRARMGDELAKALSRYQEPHRVEPELDEDGLIDLNAASFEQLRTLGLSITQAARLIALRDARGGFTSEEDVAELPGIPQSQLAELIGKARIS